MNVLLSAAFVLCWSSGFIGAKLGAQTAATPTLLMWRFLPLAAASRTARREGAVGRCGVMLMPSITSTTGGERRRDTWCEAVDGGVE